MPSECAVRTALADHQACNRSENDRLSGEFLIEVTEMLEETDDMNNDRSLSRSVSNHLA